MARAFTEAADSYLIYSGAVLTITPITFACWFYSTDADNAQTLICIGSTTEQDAFRLLIKGNAGGDPVNAFVANDGGQEDADTTTGYSINTWHHACAVFASSTSRSVYIDGGSKATNTDSRVPDNLDRTTIGRFMWSGVLWNSITGKIAEAGIYNAALTDAEVAVLATGVVPTAVRPGSLVSYLPLVRDNDEDIVGGLSFTAVNSPTIETHAPIYYPVPPMFYMKAGGEAPADINIDIGADEAAYQGTGVRILGK